MERWLTTLLGMGLLIVSGCASIGPDGGTPSGDLDLVREGRANIAFLVPGQATGAERLAAREFTEYVARITGVRLPMASRAVPGQASIRLAMKDDAGLSSALSSAARRLKYDGFALEVTPAGITVVSGAKRGLLYGVYYLLREYGGVIWFHPDPTDEGEFVPKAERFRVPCQVSVHNPEFRQRKFALHGGSLKNDHVYTWFLRNGLQLYCGSSALDKGNEHLLALDPVFDEGGHDMTNLLVGHPKGTETMQARADRLLKEHPEYFGMDAQGIRRMGGNAVPRAVQPCTSNPEVLRRMGDHALERITLFGGRENIRTLCNDDHTSWCQCGNCRKLDDPLAPRGNRHANRWWHFVNYMAGRILTPDHPENRLNTLAYQTYRFPPRLVKPDPRVSVTICPHQRCYIHSLTDPDCPANATTFRRMFEAWHEQGMHALSFEYHTQMPGTTRYLPMERAWIEDLRFYRKMDMDGYGFVTRAALSDFGRRSNPFNDHMWMSLWQLHWLTAYFSWHLDADFDRVSEELNAKYYGVAWKYMKPYRQELTNALYAPRIHMGYGTPDTALGRCGESAGLFPRLHAYLDQAEKIAAGDPLLLKRIRRDRLFLKLNWEKANEEYKATRQEEYQAVRAKTPVVVDGCLDEDCWRTAEVVTDFKVHEGGSASGSQAASPQTFARVIYDDHNLYFGIEAMKPRSGKANDCAGADGIPEAMRGSHVEIFLTPPELKGRYYHFGLSHNGHSFQALTDSPSSRDEEVKIDFSFKITEAADRWIAEVKAPVQKLAPALRDGAVWKMNIARSALTDAGAMQSSSMCGGLFHGSSSHRTLAFGAAGAVVKNGDFEDLARPVVKKHLKRHWKFPAGQVPRHWAFNENNIGEADVRTDGAASGRRYLRVRGQDSFVEQVMNIPPGKPASYSFQLKARGRGEVRFRLRDGRNRYGTCVHRKVDFPQWTPIGGVVEPAPDPGRTVFTMRITGAVDLDGLRVQALPDEEAMPTAEKHS